MLHIFLTILKIPFLLLAVLLLLILIVLLLLLFVPVRYQVNAKKDDAFSFCARVHWLLHLLSVRADFEERKMQLSVRIFGYLLIGGREKEKTYPEKDAGKTKKEKRKEPEPNARIQQKETRAGEKKPRETEPKPETKDAKPAKIEAPKPQETQKKPQDVESGRKKPGLTDRIKAVFGRARDTIRGILKKLDAVRTSASELKSRLMSYKELWCDEHTRNSYLHIKKEVWYLFRHYLPKKMEGRLLFGLKDPAATGQLLGILYLVQVFTGNRLELEADFENQVLETDIRIQGHVRVCHVVRAALGLILDKHCRITFGRVRGLKSN